MLDATKGSVWESVLGGVSVAPKRLPFWLIASAMLHALVILFPDLWSADFPMGWGDKEKGGARLPMLRAALAYSVREVAQQSMFDANHMAWGHPYHHSLRQFENELPQTTSSEVPDTLALPRGAFYPIHQLTVAPQSLTEPWLEPAESLDVAVSGRAILVLWINEHGKVVNLLVEQSDLPELFSRTVAEAFRRQGFIPGELDGKKVGSVMRIEVIYDDFLSSSVDEI